MKTAGWKKTLTFFWSVLAAHLQKDLPKVIKCDVFPHKSFIEVQWTVIRNVKC